MTSQILMLYQKVKLSYNYLRFQIWHAVSSSVDTISQYS